MEHDHVGTDRGTDDAVERLRERDLRRQIDDASSARERLLHEPDVHLGLAACRHPVEQHRPGQRTAEPLDERGDRPSLIGMELAHRCGWLAVERGRERLLAVVELPRLSLLEVDHRHERGAGQPRDRLGDGDTRTLLAERRDGDGAIARERAQDPRVASPAAIERQETLGRERLASPLGERDARSRVRPRRRGDRKLQEVGHRDEVVGRRLLQEPQELRRHERRFVDHLADGPQPVARSVALAQHESDPRLAPERRQDPRSSRGERHAGR
ncbi:MAG: hypothetical protein U0166_12360 [Acidobacteriota bacterium]